MNVTPQYGLVNCLKFTAELSCFICVCILCGLSSNNPFESHYIRDLTNYFYFPHNTSIPKENKHINNNYTTIIHNRKKEQILKGKIFLQRKILKQNYLQEN